MGTEAHITLFNTTSDADQVIQHLERLGFRVRGQRMPEDTKTELRYEDDAHIVEALSDRSDRSLSLRFALVQPPTIDQLYLSIVRNLLASGCFSFMHLENRTETLDEIQAEILEDRRSWQAAYGVATAKLSCPDAVALIMRRN